MFRFLPQRGSESSLVTLREALRSAEIPVAAQEGGAFLQDLESRSGYGCNSRCQGPWTTLATSHTIPSLEEEELVAGVAKSSWKLEEFQADRRL